MNFFTRKESMILIIACITLVSNLLLQFPLGDWMTWATITYPFMFLVIDVAHRLHGTNHARKLVLWGFVFGLIASAVAALLDATTIRIALASGTAYLLAQLFDISVFKRLSQATWWKAPMLSSTLGSIVDTVVFYWIAFSATTFLFSPDSSTWALDTVPLLGLGPVMPLWVSLAVADLIVKLILVISFLPIYKNIVQKVSKK